MKTVVNKTRKPIRVPLPRGKALHLGPGKTGEIRDDAAEHDALKKLVAAGTIEVLDSHDHRGAAAQRGSASPHEMTHGRARSAFRQTKGDR